MKKQYLTIIGLLVFLFTNPSCKKDVEAENIYNIVGKWAYYKIGEIDGPLELYKHSPGCSKDFIEFGNSVNNIGYHFCREYLFDNSCNTLEHNKLGKGVGGYWLISNINMLTRFYGFNSSGLYNDKYGNIFQADPDYYEIVELNTKTLRLHRMGQGKIQVLIFQKI